MVSLLPAWAVNVLKGDAVTSGLLAAARGVGAVIGALLLASLAHYKARGKILTIGTFVFPMALLVFAFMRWLPLSMVLLAGLGLATILVLNVASALMQSLVAEEVRGRVMSLYAMLFFVSRPVGSLLLGWAAQGIGEPPAVIINAVLALVVAALVWLFIPRMRALE